MSSQKTRKMISVEIKNVAETQKVWNIFSNRLEKSQKYEISEINPNTQRVIFHSKSNSNEIEEYVLCVPVGVGIVTLELLSDNENITRNDLYTTLHSIFNFSESDNKSNSNKESNSNKRNSNSGSKLFGIVAFIIMIIIITGSTILILNVFNYCSKPTSYSEAVHDRLEKWGKDVDEGRIYIPK